MFIAKRKGASLSSMGDKVYKIGLIIGVLFHIILFSVWQKYVIKVPKFKEQTVVEVIEIPPILKMNYTPPPLVRRPTEPIISEDADISDNSTIDVTDLDPFRIVVPSPEPNVKRTHFVEYDKDPVLIKMIKPVYPEIDRQAGVEGIVILRIKIGTNGLVKSVGVLKGLTDGCNQAAIDAVKQWIYEPAYQRDKPVAVWIGQSVKFKLED